MPLFTLKSILRLTGLRPDTVRVWEKRYGAVRPERSNNGRRMYSETEVNRLKLLAELSQQGHSISTIAKLKDDKLIALLSSIKSTNPLSKTSVLNQNAKIISDELLNAIDSFDLKKLEVQLSKANYILSPRDLIFYLIPQLMIQVGVKINNGSISIAQEHALSELIKSNIHGIYNQLKPVNGTMKPEKTLLFATPENHLHEFAVLMAAVLCRFNGFNTHYLGANLPASALITAVKKIKPHAIVLGFSSATSSDTKNRDIQFIELLAKNLNHSLIFWLGGAVPKIKHKKFKQELHRFETLEELEKKLTH